MTLAGSEASVASVPGAFELSFVTGPGLATSLPCEGGNFPTGNPGILRPGTL